MPRYIAMQWFRSKRSVAISTAVAGKPVELPRRRTALLMPLEPRIMFDGAIAATVDAAPVDPAQAFAGSNVVAVDAGGADLFEPAAVAPPETGHDVVFVDSRVQDAAGLLANIAPQTEIVYLDGTQDGLQQIADYLGGHPGANSVQLFAHGNEGDLWLGSTYLSSTNISEHASTLAAIGAGIQQGGDILIYGCETAGGELGSSFVSSFAALTGRDVAASDDRTGASGDWDLEISVGSIDAAPALAFASTTSYAYDLAIITVTSNADSGAGTLRNALAAAGSGDTITFNAGMSIALTSGELLINKNLTIDGDLDNNGTADVTLDANYSSRVLSITSGTVSLDGLVIQEGRVSGNGGGLNTLPAGGLGGGISITGGTVTISNSTITNNVASGGGGGGSGSGYSYGGGGGGGFLGLGGGNGGPLNGSSMVPRPGGAGSGGSGGIGGFAYYSDQAGKGGSTVGGSGGLAAVGYFAGGAGGTASTIGGGGGGAGGSAGGIGGVGGAAAGGLYIGSGATVFMSATTLSNNLGAGGGGGGGSNTASAGNGGAGVGGILNAGTLNYQSSTVTFSGNTGTGGARGTSGSTAAANGASVGDLTGGTINSNFSPNVAPVLANLNGDSVTFVEGTGAVRLDNGSNATVTDTDSANFSGGNVTVAIISNRVSGEDVLSVRNEGSTAGLIGVSGSNITFGGAIIGTVAGGTGTSDLVITLNASATPAAVQALVRNLTYSNSNSTQPSTADRAVRVTVNDGDGGTSNSSQITVSVTGVNDAPTLSATGATVAYTENGSAVDLFSGVSISTVESGQTITQLVLQVTNLADRSNEILIIDGTAIVLTEGNSGTTTTNGVSYSVVGGGSTAGVILTKAAGLSASAAQTLVDGISYRHDGDAPNGAASRFVTLLSITDSGGIDDDGVDTGDLAIEAQIDITAVNDAPTLSGGPYSLTSVDEDTTSSGTLVSTILAGLTYADADTSASAGVANSGIAVNATSGSGAWQYSTDGTTWTDVGTVSSAASLLLASTTQVRYIPDGIDGGTARLTFRAWDQTSGSASSNGSRSTADARTNGGTTAFSTGTAQASLTVTAVNDAPTLSATGGAFTYTENGSAVDLFSSVSISTIEAGQSINQLTLTVDDTVDGSNEILRFDGTDIQLTHNNAGATTGGNAVDYLVTIDGTGLVSVILSNAAGLSVATAQTLVEGMSYRNDSNTPYMQDRVFTLTGIRESDNTTTALSIVTTVSVVAVNDAPSITAPGSISVVEDIATALTGISFSDMEAGSASVTVTLSTASGALSGASSDGVTATGSGTGTLTLTGNIADINTFIAASKVSFLTALDGSSNVTLNVAIDDSGNTGADPGNTGTSSSEAASTTVTLNVASVNDAPTVTTPTTIAVNEDTATALTGISFADADVASGSVTATLSVASGVLAATSGSGVTVGGAATALTLTGSIADINAFIAASGITFTPAADTSGDVTLTTSIDDGGNTGSGGAQTGSDTTTLQVTAVNDRPAITAPGSISVTEDVSIAVTGISFSDVDAGSGGVTVTLSVATVGPAAVNGALTATSGSGVSVSGSGTSTLTLSGTVADINAFIVASSVSFLNAQDATISYNLTVTIDDGGNTGADPGTSGTGSTEARSTTVLLAVTAVNDAPVNTVPGAQQVDQDGSLVFSSANSNAISIADVDASSVQVTLTAGNGVITLSGITGLSFSTGSGAGDGTMTFTGSVAAVNTALQGLTFTPTVGYAGAASLRVIVNDQGAAGSGGAQSDDDTIDIAVQAATPVITGVATSTPDGTYKLGDMVTLTVTFDDVVNVDDADGSPSLQLATGVFGTTASYVGGSGTNVLTFEYVVQSGDNTNDLDYADTMSLQLGGATIRSNSGVDAVLDLPTPGGANSLAGGAALVIDGVLPTATLALLGAASADSVTVTYELTLSEAVSGIDAADFVLLGTGSVSAAIQGVEQIDAQTYRITVANVQGEGTLALSLVAAGAGIVDAAGNAITGDVSSAVRDVDTVPTVPETTSEPASLPPVMQFPSAPVTTPLIVLPVVTPPGIDVAAGNGAGGLSISSIVAASSLFITPLSEPAADAPRDAPVDRSVVLVVPSTGSYLGVATERSDAPLQSLPDLGVRSVSGERFSIALPYDTFTVDEDSGAQVLVQARMTNGQPLPSWLKFDARTGTLTGRPPAGFSGGLDVEISARDNKGNRAASVIHIEVKGVRPAAGRAGLDAQFKFARHDTQLDVRLLSRLDAAVREPAELESTH